MPDNILPVEPVETPVQQLDASSLTNYGTSGPMTFPSPAIGGGISTAPDPVLEGFDRLDAMKPDTSAPTFFDWDKENTDKFKNSTHFKDLGIDPELGQLNEMKYEQAQTFGDAAKEFAKSAIPGLSMGFNDMLDNWKNIGSWFSDPSLQDSFKQDQLEEANRKRTDFANQYPIFTGESPSWYASMFNSLQSTTPFLGSLTEIAAETIAVKAIEGLTLGAAAPELEPIEAAHMATLGVADAGEVATQVPSLIKNSIKATEAINTNNVTANLFRNLSEISQKIPGIGNTLAFAGELGADVADKTVASAGVTVGKGLSAFVNDLRSVNVATAFASGNAASTYQQQLNTQIEQYRKDNGGTDPGTADIANMKENALRAAKTDGALNAYAMLFLEKVAFGNLLSAKPGAQAFLERNSFRDIGVKPFWAEDAAEAPLYNKQKFKWYDLKSNLFGNYGEGARNIATKGVEFGIFGNVMSGIDNTIKSYYDAKYNNDDVSFLTAIKSGVNSQFTSEGAKTFISGFLQGSIMMGLGGAALGKAKDAIIEKGGNVYDKWSKSAEAYQEDKAEAIKKKADYTAAQSEFVNATNAAFADPLNPIKDMFHNLILQNMFDTAGKSAMANNSTIKDFHDIKDDATREFLLKMIKSGIGDMWVDRIKSYSNMYNQDELCQMLNVPSSPENYHYIKEAIASLPDRVKDLTRISKNVEKVMGSPFNPYAKDPITGKRLYKDGSEEFKVQANNKAIHDRAKDMLVTMHDEAERKIVRQVELLNGTAGNDNGILKMPFAKDLDFSVVHAAMSPDTLDREIYLSNLDANVTDADKGKSTLTDKKNATVAYKKALDKYIDGLKKIYDKGAYPERAEDIQKHRDESQEGLVVAFHDYLQKSLLEVNLDGKTTQVKKGPTLNEVRDGMNKMMDYYDLGTENNRMLDNINFLLDPSIIKKYQMAFFKEGMKRQEEANPHKQEGADLIKERAKKLSLIDKLHTPGEGEMSNKDALLADAEARIKEIDARLKEIGLYEGYSKRKTPTTPPTPPPPPTTDSTVHGTTTETETTTTAGTEDTTGEQPENTDEDLGKIKAEIRDYMTNMGDIVSAESEGERPTPVKLSADAKIYLDDNPQLNIAVKSLMSQLAGIYRSGKDKDAEEFIDGLLNKHFDQVVEALSFPALKGSPKVEEVAAGVYAITGDTSKKYTSVIDANKALRDKYPEFEIQGRKFQVGQTLFNDEGIEYTIEGRNSLKSGRNGKVKVMTDDELMEYSDTKPDLTRGKLPIVGNRIYAGKVGEIAEIRNAGFTQEEQIAHRIQVDAALREIPKDSLYDNIALTVVKGPTSGSVPGAEDGPAYSNGIIKDNPYIKFRNDDYTITLNIQGVGKPMYIQSPYKNVYDFGNGPTFDLPKENFELIYDLQGKSLDDAYNEYTEAATKMKQLAQTIDKVLKAGGTLTGAKLEKVMIIDTGIGSLDFTHEQRPTLSEVESSGKTVLAVVDRVEEKTLWGKFDKNTNPIPTEGPTGSKHLALVELANGNRAWVEMHTPSFSATKPEEFDKFVADNINLASKQIQASKADPDQAAKIAKIANDNLKGVFITQNPNAPVVVTFTHIRISPKTGYINVGLKVERNNTDGEKKQVLNAEGANPFHVTINAKSGLPLNFGRVESGAAVPDGSKFIERLEKEVNDYFAKPAQKALIGELSEPIQINMSNVHKSYTVGNDGELSDDVVMGSTINTTADIVKNQKVDYSFPATSLVEDIIPTDEAPKDDKSYQQSLIDLDAEYSDLKEYIDAGATYDKEISDLLKKLKSGEISNQQYDTEYKDILNRQGKDKRTDASNRSIEYGEKKFELFKKYSNSRNNDQIAASKLADAGYVAAEEKPEDNSLDALLGELNSADKRISEGTAISAEDIVAIEEFRNDIEANLPGFISVSDTLIPNLLNGNIKIGEFITHLDTIGNLRGEIRTSPNAASKYHEAFHGLFRMLLSREQQRQLIDEAHIKNPVTDKKLAAFRKNGYKYENAQEEQDRFQEEWIGDKFDQWKKNNKVVLPGGIKAWFQRLWNFIKETFNRLTGNRIEATFYKYNRQGFKYAKLQENEFTTTPNSSALKLIETGEQEYKKPDGTTITLTKTLDQNTGVQLVNTIAAIYGMERSTSTLSHEGLVNSILDDYKATLDPRQAHYADMVKSLHKTSPESARRFVERLKEVYGAVSGDTGRDSIKEAIDEKLKLRNYSEDEAGLSQAKEEQLKGRTSWEDSADMVGGYNTLLPSIREYIEQTVVQGTDEFGNSIMKSGRPVWIAVDGQKVYNGLSQLLRNVPDRQVMINKMIDARNNGDAGAVIRRLFTDVQFSRSQGAWNVQKNPQLFQQFINGFRRASVDHITGELIKGTSKAYSANRQDSSQKQVTIWASAFDQMYLSGYQNTSAKKTYQKQHSKALVELRDLVSDTTHDFANENEFMTKAQSLSNDLKEQLGISLDPKYIQYSIAHNKNDKPDYMATLMTTYSANPIEVADLSGLHTVLLRGDNPFSEDITGATTRLKDIAAGNAIFDENVDSANYVDAEGKTRHSMQKYNYLLEQVSKLNDQQEIERLSNNPDTSGSHLLSDEKWLNWDKKLAIVDGLHTGEEGTVSKSWNTRETNAYIFTLYGTPHQKDGVYGTWVIPIVVSDKSTMWMESSPVISSVYKDGSKLKISEPAMNKLYSIVKDEIDRIARVKEEIDTLPEEEKIQGRHIADNKGVIKGLKFDKAAAMLGELGKNYESDFDMEKMKEYPIKQQISNYFLGKEDGVIAKYIDEELVSSGLVNKIGDNYMNALLPEYLWSGLANTKLNDGLNLSNDFMHNVAQVYISNYLNAEGFMHLLFPYGTNVKRMSVANSAGDSAKSFITSPELGIYRPFTSFHVATIKEPKDENGFEHADSQMWCTEEGMRYTRFGFGKLTQIQADLLNKISLGKPITKDEMFGDKGLIKNGDALTALKPAFFDGKTSIKCSVVMLSKDMLMVKDSTGKWTPDIRYKDTLYPMWKSMRDFEIANDTVAFVTPESSFKTVIKNSADSASSLSHEHFHEFDTDYLRDQVYLPSNKTEMTKPTQPVWNLIAEQDDDTPVYGTTVGEIKKQYGEAVSNRLKANWNNALNAMFEHTDGRALDVDSPIDHENITAKMGQFYDQMRENLQATGANEQTLSFLEVRDGEPVYPALDFPATLEKYTNMVMRYFGKVMSETVPGISATKFAPYGVNVIRQIHEVDDNGSPVPGKWTVINNEEYRENPEKYEGAKKYTDPAQRSFSGLKAGDYIIDHLRANVPEFDSNGVHTGVRYNEYKFPIHHKDDNGSQDSPVAMGYRNDIPYADKNSGSVFKRVDTLPMHLGSIQANPSAQSKAGGKDHDADKDFLQTADTYSSNGEMVPYGTATTDQGKFNEFVQWNRMNNSVVSNYEKQAMAEDEEVQQIKKDLKDLKVSNEHITGKLIAVTNMPEGIINIRAYRNDLLKQHSTQARTVEELEKQLKEINAVYILQALDEAKLPYRTADFIARGGEKLNVGVQNNMELKAKIALAGNNNVTGGDDPINLRPTSTSLLSNLISPDDGNSFYSLLTKYKEENPDIDKKTLANIDDLLTMFQDSSANLNEMRGISIAQRSVSAGKNSVGVSANGVPTLSFFMEHKINIDPKSAITYDGVKYDTLGGKLSTDGTRKFEALMSYINTMTDNAKLELASKLGLSIDALSDAMSMSATGMDTYDVQLYLLQPVIREYYKSIAYLKGSLKTPEEERLSKSTVLQGAIDKTGIKPDDVDESVGLTRQELEDNLLGKGGKATSYHLLRDIQKIQAIGNQIFQTSRVTALAGGLPSSWEGFDNVNNSINELGINDGKAVENHDGVLNISHALLTDPITSIYIKQFTQLGKLSPILFMERSDIFRRLMNIQLAQFRNIGRKEADAIIKQLKQDLISHLSILSLMGKPGWGDMGNGMIYTTLPGERITDVYKRLKQLKGKNANYFINEFLRPVLAGQLDNKSKVDKLVSNNWAKLSDDRQIQIRDSFMEGYNNPKTREDFEKIFKYLLVKDGGQFKDGSFTKFIATAMFKDLYDSTADVKKELSSGKYNDAMAMKLFRTDWDSILNNFVMNYALHPDNTKYLKKVKQPIIDTDAHTHDALKELGFNVYGAKGKEMIDLPVAYRSGSHVYKLVKVFKRDIGDHTGNIIARGDNIAKGYRGVYELTDTKGAINTYRAGGATFGQLPSTSRLLNGYAVPQKSTQLPYSPDSKVPIKEVTTKVQSEPAAVPETSQEAVKQLAERHNVFITNVGGKSIAYKNGAEFQVPEGIKTPKDLLGYLERQAVDNYNPDEGYDEDDIAEMAQRAALKRAEKSVPSQSMQADLFAPKSQPVNTIQKPYPGVENIPDTGLSVKQANHFIDLLQPQILNQAYVENKAYTANRMFSFGLRWAKNIPNESEKSAQRTQGLQQRPGKIAIKAPSKYDGYGYYATDQNNKSIPSIKNLQPIIDFIQSKLGIDMKDYDSVLANIYESGSFIHQHRDITESTSAKNYPVIVINLGADGNLLFHTDFSDESKHDLNSNTYNQFEMNKNAHAELPIKNGGVYAFGVNGVNRFTFNHRVSEKTQNTVTKPIKVPEWDSSGKKVGEKTLTNYRITLTFRRAQDLSNEAITPNRVTETKVTDEEVQKKLKDCNK